MTDKKNMSKEEVAFIRQIGPTHLGGEAFELLCATALAAYDDSDPPVLWSTRADAAEGSLAAALEWKHEAERLRTKLAEEK